MASATADPEVPRPATLPLEGPRFRVCLLQLPATSARQRRGGADRAGTRCTSLPDGIAGPRIQSHCPIRRWQAGYGYPERLYSL